jgi:hypothetical protein
VKLPTVVVRILKLFVAMEGYDRASPVREVCVAAVDDKAIVCVPVQAAAVFVMTMLNFEARSISLKTESFTIHSYSTADEMRVAVSSHNSTLTPRVLVNGVPPNDCVSALR